MPPNPCRTVVIAAPAPTDNPRDLNPPRTDRTFATKLVRISGTNLDDNFLSDNIITIDVEETARGLSKARVVLYNNDLRLTDNVLFQANVKVEIYTGYESTTLQKHGTYYCAKPHFMFKKGAALIELICYSEEWPLTIGEQRLNYQNMRDSDIAAQIASRYGLQTNIDQTDPIHEQVAQWNATDMEFLEERARLYGFDVFISEGVLNFHAPVFTDSGITLFYGETKVSQLASFDVTVDPWMSGQVWTRSGIDRLSGQEWSFDGTTESDTIGKTIAQRSQSAFIPASKIATFNGVRPQRFIVGGGHEQTTEDGQTQVQGFVNATSWVTHGIGYIVGIETIKARQLVQITGVGSLAGYYYITRTHHKIERGNYSLRFEGIMPGTGTPSQPAGLANGGQGRPLPADVTSESPSSGTAVVG